MTELGLEINYQGMWEEFHQKQGNHYMYAHHKAIRLALIKELEELRNENSNRNPSPDPNSRLCP